MHRSDIDCLCQQLDTVRTVMPHLILGVSVRVRVSPFILNLFICTPNTFVVLRHSDNNYSIHTCHKKTLIFFFLIKEYVAHWLYSS